MTTWQLPSHVYDRLAPASHWLEAKRRQLMDHLLAHGYRLIMPPLAEYQEALAMGGQDVDRRMFKVVDLLSGRLLGIRPDITPQAARIDAHVLAESGVTRLCYAERVLHSEPSAPFAQREPMQIGAEIYGEPHWLADVEAIRLLHQSLALCNIHATTIELHHMGIIRALVSGMGFANQSHEAQEFIHALHIKDQSAITAILTKSKIDRQWVEKSTDFVGLYGGFEVLDRAILMFAQESRLLAQLHELKAVATSLAKSHPQMSIQFDLADGRGYDYHTGLMFSAYAEGWSQALAHGGRYDGFGEKFGRSRAATGFTMDLLEAWGCFCKQQQGNIEPTISALPFQHRVFVDAAYENDPQVKTTVEELRSQGFAVIVASTHGRRLEEAAMHQGCSHALIGVNEKWVLMKMKTADGASTCP